MKLLFFIRALTGGGAERVLATLSNAFVQKGYDVSLATSRRIPFAYTINNKVSIYDLYQNCPIEEFNVCDKIKRYLIRLKNIRTITRAVNPDIVISFMTDMNYDVILSLIGFKIPIICSEHTTITRKISVKSAAMRKLLYPFASAVTVLTKRDYAVCFEKFRNVVRMPNPCDIEVEPIPMRKRDKVVLAIGRLDAWYIKGFDNLIKCWANLCGKYPNWRLVIAGDGVSISNKEYLFQLVDQYDCNNIDFIGFRKDILTILCRSSVFCLTSRFEGLPMALIEAMMCGCCCVAFDCVTGPREIISNNIDGLLVKEQDVRAMENALDRVMRDCELRTTLSHNAIISSEQFSSEHIVSRWEILFNKVV